MILDISKLQKGLAEGEVVVNFTKKDGTPRKMLCTWKNIPKEKLPKNPGREFDGKVLRVFDVEKFGWRSFRLDSINSIEYGV